VPEEEPHTMSSVLKNAGGSVVLSRSDILRMKQTAVIITPELQKQRQAEAAAKRNALMQKSNQRKTMMMSKEKAARERAPQTEAQLIAECRRIAYAEPISERELTHDSAKAMNTLGTRAEVFVVRVGQLSEKIQIEKADREYEENIDRRAEYHRRQDVLRVQREEREKQVKNKKEQTFLCAQIAQRAHQTIMDNEEMELEKEKQLKRQRDLQAEELERIKRGRQKAHQEALKISAANAQAKVMKMQEYQQEAQADLKILQYQKNKARQESRAEAAIVERKKREELQIAKLRAAQEKSADTAAEEDEARAQRAYEEMERKERRSEQAEREAKQRVGREMRLAQKQACEQKATVVAQQREEDYREARTMQIEIKRAERSAAEQLRAQAIAKKLNQKMVLEQVSQKKTTVQRRAAQKDSDARAIKKDFLVERFKLERVRDEKIKALKKRGVGQEYFSEFGKMTLTQGDVRV